MFLDDVICSVFDLVDVSGYEGIVQLCYVQNIDIGVYFCFKGIGVEDGVSFYFIQDGGQCCDV